MAVFAATHYVAGDETMQRAVGVDRGGAARAPAGASRSEGKLLEAQRLRVRTEHDLEMLAETGRVLGHRELQPPPRRPGAGRDALHAARLLPQGLPGGHRREPRGGPPAARAVRRATDPARTCWSSTGSACPRRMDNRPLRFEEFVERVPQCVFVSATPGPFELEHSDPDGRAGDPADRPGRPRGRRSCRPRARSTTCWRASTTTVAAGRARPGHHADQEDGRGPDRLPGRRRRPGPVPALGHRHHHPHRDPARAAARAPSTSWSASTCSARASTCPRCPWWPSSMPTRRASCARPRR